MKIPLATHQPSRQPTGLPVLRLGFRPFYLGGAYFGIVSIALWLASLHGFPVAGRSPAMSGLAWHVHEMVFGFSAAIVVGFLLTAIRAWTSRDTPHGAQLAALWLLWAAGRLLVWAGPEPLAAAVDSAFLPITALILLRVLLAARNHRNVFLTVALFLLGALNALFHWWAAHGRLDLALQAAYSAIGLVLLFVVVIAGRIVPTFTMNAIPGFAVKRWKFVETLAAPVTVLALCADAIALPGALVAAVAFAAAALHATRIVGWRSWRVGARPILWILHVAYAWVPLGFAMLALDVAPHSLAIHALTVGVIGCAIVAMITRTALGHTGRPLRAGPNEIACYWLLIAATLVRVFGPWVAPDMTSVWIDAAGACWVAAFAVYAMRYTGYLTSPRIDGKAG
ncbi:NnrS family protein [Burkholderia sp. MSMB617WGS]|uniref:NnrS family protein n=1 Tax=Burkholderia sp. MSMB617WGS TaxID=1637831 RepID=UPI00075FB12F|nr:NnrS family protein [Burkholderia sp. MSMB617WGS]AOK46556.1 NnrS family protein [Burkholderia sp. MSMB617WGS]